MVKVASQIRPAGRVRAHGPSPVCVPEAARSLEVAPSTIQARVIIVRIMRGMYMMLAQQLIWYKC